MTVLQGLQRKDELLARQGIRHLNPETPDEIEQQFKRGQRQRSLQHIIGGEDRGSEGRQYGILELILEYRSAFGGQRDPDLG